MSIFAHREWHNTAVEMSDRGVSGRKIAKALGMGKSQVNDFLAHYRENITALTGKKQPVVLYWDLETSLMLSYHFRIWDENIPISRVKRYSHLLSASWAFDDGEVQSIRLTPDDVRTCNDLDVVIEMIKAIQKADIIVTFNGKRFDQKVLNTRALFWGLPPIIYPKHIDLMQEAKKIFNFPSNSMQNISKYLGLDGKIATGGTLLWERCANYEDYDACDAALEEMRVYGDQDIEATRDLRYRLLGWSKNTPNVGTIVKEVNGDVKSTELHCVHCGGTDLTPVGKRGYTSVSSFDLYRCGNSTCRGISRVNASGKSLVNYI